MCPDFKYSEPLSDSVSAFNLKTTVVLDTGVKDRVGGRRERKSKERTGKERQQIRKGACWGHVSEQ